MPTTVNFRMREDAVDLLPKKAHHDDAAFDIRSAVTVTVPAHRRVLVSTGLYMELPFGFEAQIRPRSGLALKHGITVLNTPGTVDAGYRGEVSVMLFNTSDVDFAIERGDRIAQMVIQNLPDVELVQVDELAASVRGEGGFGSTKVK
jgi:dUTP pyrophosphatase